MNNARWMIYGAYGYTGRLVIEEAIRRGHRPLLAGRSAEKLEPLAERYGLDWVSLPLDDPALAQTVADVELVFHAAGPFIYTSTPMRAACLAGRTNYVDISGEYPVFEATYAHHEAAVRQGIVLMSGAGFDIVPTDCLAKYVADQIPDAITLEIALDINNHYSSGTARSILELFAQQGTALIRRSGELKPHPFGLGRREVQFTSGVRSVWPVPIADVVAAYHTTNIPNITAYMAVSPALMKLARFTAPVGNRILSRPDIRTLCQKLVDRAVQEPNSRLQQTRRSFVWAKAVDPRGHLVQAWMVTPGTYYLTALAGVRAVEKILNLRPVGALTPASAFGADFALELDGVKRFDTL